jgi:hypothetical protein
LPLIDPSPCVKFPSMPNWIFCWLLCHSWLALSCLLCDLPVWNPPTLMQMFFIGLAMLYQWSPHFQVVWRDTISPSCENVCLMPGILHCVDPHLPCFCFFSC